MKQLALGLVFIVATTINSSIPAGAEPLTDYSPQKADMAKVQRLLWELVSAPDSQRLSLIRQYWLGPRDRACERFMMDMIEPTVQSCSWVDPYHYDLIIRDKTRKVLKVGFCVVSTDKKGRFEPYNGPGPFLDKGARK